MDEGETTQLQPRAVQAVKRVRARVERGVDAGASSGEGGAVLTIGTSPDADLVLRDPAVSRYHLELRRGADGISVRDLGSTNGTWLGGARIASAIVPAGTRLAVGSTVIAVEEAGAVAAPDAPIVELPGLVAVSPAMREVSRVARKLAVVTTSVLLEGETGVGKEVVARAIHEAGPRRAGPFIVVDCGSLPATLIASQLFGHEKGAFTGADTRRIGAFERAGGGTVLLDEIGELPLDLQPALLGVLERRRFCRVGGSVEIDVDVRVLAATNRDLRAEVNSGSFRSDLYYRLAVARIVIPPLRERPEDVEPLVASFVEKITGVPGDNPLAGAMDQLRRHRWTGNVRELRNVVEAALVFGQVELEGGVPVAAPSGAARPVAPYREARAAALAAFEREYLTRLLDESNGNVSEAARRARMDRPYLTTLLKRHGLR
jgi:DNA-binding NtrC family response regulator